MIVMQAQHPVDPRRTRWIRARAFAHRARLIVLALAAALLASRRWRTRRSPAPIIADAARIHPVLARHGMVASQEARATRVGVEILKAGGNAVDAAVAVGFALAVTLPRAGNIGGGGFMLVHLAGRNETVAIDYRETAPAATTREVFLDADGRGRSRRSRATPGSRSACPARSPGWRSRTRNTAPASSRLPS